MVRSRFLRQIALVAASTAILASAAFGQRTGRRGAGALRMVPADALFCVKVSNLEGTLEQIDSFLDGVAPTDMSAKKALLDKLEGTMGEGWLENVRTRANWVLFGATLPSEGAANPMADFFIGLLVPVRDYDAFVSENPCCGEPDDKGVSRITVDGNVRATVARCGRYALVSGPQDLAKLARAAGSIGTRTPGLTGTLDADELSVAGSSPIWLYANVKGASAMMRPMIQMGLAQMKMAMAQARESGQGAMGDPQAIMEFYTQILGFMLDETDHVSLAFSPGAEKLEVAFGMTAVPDTTMAKILGTGPGPRGGHKSLLGYLDNGAAINVATDIDHEGLKTMYNGLFDLLGGLGTEGLTAPELEKLKGSTMKVVDAVGDSLAFSFTVGDGDAGPFSMKEVFRLKDAKLFTEAIDEQLRLMNEGAFDKIYKGFGMEMNFKMKRDVGTYKGVKIDSAQVKFELGDEDSPQNQMLKKIWGEGINYRWAVLDNYGVYAIGDNVDKEIRGLIDQVKAGGPEGVNSEMKAALAAIPESGDADVVGTINLMRLVKMGLGMVPEAADAGAKLDVESKSSIAFAGKGGDARMIFRMVLPKEHIVELKSAIESLDKQMKEKKEN